MASLKSADFATQLHELKNKTRALEQEKLKEAGDDTFDGHQFDSPEDLENDDFDSIVTVIVSRVFKMMKHISTETVYLEFRFTGVRL